jgi:predicted acetyltransferase
MTVDVEPAGYEEKATLRRLMQLYLYDFTEFAPGEIAIDAQGEFPYRYLDHYWAAAKGEQRHPFLIRVDGRLAGFALVRVVNAVAVMTEFFVMRQYRRTGAGTEAARAVFLRFPGKWVVHELERNLPAQAFWRRAIAPVALNGYEETREPDGAVTQRFEVRPPLDS